jgi:hypothetical protein
VEVNRDTGAKCKARERPKEGVERTGCNPGGMAMRAAPHRLTRALLAPATVSYGSEKAGMGPRNCEPMTRKLRLNPASYSKERDKKGRGWGNSVASKSIDLNHSNSIEEPICQSSDLSCRCR